MATIQQLAIYPVKSCRGIAVETWPVDARGLRHDRRFMIVTPDGKFVTQRELGALALVETSITDAELRLARRGHGEVVVPLVPSGGSALRVEVWRSSVDALAVGDDVDAWLGATFGRPLRLVYMPETSHRATNPAYAEGFETAFSDGYPILVIGAASLAELNARLATPVPMERFRPNVVVAGSEAFAEDGWRDVASGDAALRIVKPCDRCVVTTIDQRTAEQGTEPLRTLATYRKIEGKVLFGQNAVVVRTGTLRVGARIELA